MADACKSGKLNPTVRIIPIVYECLPDEKRFLTTCKKIVNYVGDHPLFRRYEIQVVLDTELSAYSQYLTQGIIPPREHCVITPRGGGLV